jgi:hypothetical protein
VIADTNLRRCALNPVAMHALYLLDACGNDLATAKAMASINAQTCEGTDWQCVHWLAVYSVLNLEGARA